MRRAVITGLGTVNPLANNVADTWTGLCNGQSGVNQITQFDASPFRTQIAGELKNFEPDQLFGSKQARRLDRYSQFALAAAMEAIDDSNLELESEDPFRVGVILGTGIGGMRTFEEECEKYQQKGPDRISPFLIPRMMPNGATAAISIHFGLRGPTFSVSSACASAADAIAMARDIILAGRGDAIITGGAEAAITPLGLGGFCAARSLSERNDAPQIASRPFDQNRDGFVLGEGAGVIVVEEYEHARRRGANIYCEITGCGQASDAHHITAPDPHGAGAINAMRLAIADAGRNVDEIDYINAHATSTHLGDLAEANAICQVFGSHIDKLAVSCTKSMIGHLCGGSGGVATIAAALSIRHGTIHPTINCDDLDPEVKLDITPNTAREIGVRNAMLNNFGFGGHNSSLVLSKI
ncbi:beta-ketoacyl-ACP synthase II [Blastopirellula marina]|uniref:beta-ketoacyl-ACP synthase II n=1 Tax=Blastopirellula marina TaxID=124 RepID=UPI0002F36E53|nr:beta-ketoacyl-ACP synthase II [Blastopirellula marina]